MYVLYRAAELISEGSELLLLVPSLAGIVGSVILPLLGAVPEGVMVIMSGSGTHNEVLNRLKIGIGTIAGSTIFLLTLPWFAAVWYGRVCVQHGRAQYSADLKGRWRDLPFLEGGVGISDTVRRSAKIMMVTTSVYIVVQLPASVIRYRLGVPRTYVLAPYGQ